MISSRVFPVSTLMALPEAQGLFQRAIGESGGAIGMSALVYESLAVRGPKDERLLAALAAPSSTETWFLPTTSMV